MKLLAVDIGTGTQDILLFDPRADVENSLENGSAFTNNDRPSSNKIGHPAGEGYLVDGSNHGWWPKPLGSGSPSESWLSGFLLHQMPRRTFNDDLEVIEYLVFGL